MCLITSNPTPAYLVTADAAGPHVETLRAAVRARRASEAAYGRALTQIDYTLPVEQRDALHKRLRDTIDAARSKVDAAVGALIAAMEGAL